MGPTDLCGSHHGRHVLCGLFTDVFRVKEKEVSVMVNPCGQRWSNVVPPSSAVRFIAELRGDCSVKAAKVAYVTAPRRIFPFPYEERLQKK